MGGLSKRATFLQDDWPPNLRVDAGNLFFDNNVIRYPQRLPQARITAQAIVEAYNQMGYDAVCVAGRDLAGSSAFLLELADRAHFPLLSANLVDNRGELLFPASVSLKRAGLRISLIGLTGEPGLGDAAPEELAILPWPEVLPALIKEIKPSSDLIILLSNLPPQTNRVIAEQYQDIHVLLQSGSTNHNMAPLLLNNTLISQVGHEGKYVGHLRLNWTASQNWQRSDNELLNLQKEYDRLDWLVSRVEKRGGPQIVYRDDEEKQAAFAEQQARHQELAEKIKEAAGRTNAPQATFSHQFHPLQSSLADDPRINALLKDARQQANQLRRTRGLNNHLKEYSGSSSCRSCHEQIHQAWARTRHAAAYQTLTTRDQNNNQRCVYCHVTGLNQANAHLAAGLGDTLKAVGCEACHGPAAQHAAAPAEAPLPGLPSASLCLTCHSPEHDDSFNFDIDRAKVHPTTP